MVGGGGGGGGWRMWAWPRILSARIALYYGRTISNLLPTGLCEYCVMLACESKLASRSSTKATVAKTVFVE